MKRQILSSITALSDMLTTTPALFAIPAFAGLKTVITNLNEEKKKCNCSGKADLVKKLQGYCQGALLALGTADKAKMKMLLNVEQICYYTRNATSKKLELTCF